MQADPELAAALGYDTRHRPLQSSTPDLIYHAPAGWGPSGGMQGMVKPHSVKLIMEKHFQALAKVPFTNSQWCPGSGIQSRAAPPEKAPCQTRTRRRSGHSTMTAGKNSKGLNFFQPSCNGAFVSEIGFSLVGFGEGVRVRGGSVRAGSRFCGGGETVACSKTVMRSYWESRGRGQKHL